MSSIKNFIKRRKQEIIKAHEQVEPTPEQTSAKWRVEEEVVINAPAIAASDNDEDAEQLIADAAKAQKSFDWTKRSGNAEKPTKILAPEAASSKRNTLDELQSFIGIRPTREAPPQEPELTLESVASQVRKEAPTATKKKPACKGSKKDVLSELLQPNTQKFELRSAADVWRVVGAWDSLGVPAPKFSVYA